MALGLSPHTDWGTLTVLSSGKSSNPFGGKLAILFRSTMVIYPLAKTASPIYIAMAVGGVKLYQFFIVHASPFLVCPSGPREVDMIENLDPLGFLGISHQPQPIALFDPCLLVLVGLRPVNDFGTASVACIKEEILKEASIEVIGVIVVCIAR